MIPNNTITIILLLHKCIFNTFFGVQIWFPRITLANCNNRYARKTWRNRLGKRSRHKLSLSIAEKVITGRCDERYTSSPTPTTSLIPRRCDGVNLGIKKTLLRKSKGLASRSQSHESKKKTENTQYTVRVSPQWAIYQSVIIVKQFLLFAVVNN